MLAPAAAVAIRPPEASWEAAGAFPIPALTAAQALDGLVYLGALTAARLRKNRRLGYMIVAVIALGLPGPDPITTALELLPMWILFEGSIWLAVFTERRGKRLQTAMRVAEEGAGR